MMQTKAFACTHIGRRKNNEDSYALEPALGMFAVADGMGGYHGGEVASQLALSTIHEFLQRNVEDGETTWPFGMKKGRSFLENLVDISVRMAHHAIVEKRTGALSQMGTTLAALFIDESSLRHRPQVIIGHVGDSRVYRLRGGDLVQLTLDHSLYEQLKATGMSLPPLEQFSQGNVITRALGMSSEKEMAPDLSVVQAQRGDRFLLCTDGLSGPVDEEQLRSLLRQPDPQAACEALVLAAYDNGGKDNITALVVDIL